MSVLKNNNQERLIVKEMAENAAHFVAAHTLEQSIWEIHNPSGQFRKGALYVGYIDDNGIVLASGGFPSTKGHSIANECDSHGNYLFKDMMKIKKTGSGGWVRYWWPNPETGKEQEKESYVVPVQGGIIASGHYL